MNEKNDRDLEQEIIHDKDTPLSQIKVGIYKDGVGEIFDIATLEELARTGDRHTIYMTNYGHVGDVVCELVIRADEWLMNKLAYLRSKKAEAAAA